MIRHLKVRGILQKDLQNVEVIILEQTHVGDGFGNSKGPQHGEFSTRAFRFANIVLYSYDTIHNFRYYPTGNGENKEVWILVKGSDRRAIPTDPLLVTLEEWTRLKAAIKAYNLWGGRDETAPKSER